ncbi:Tyrosine-protein kinase ptk [Tritonibacter multivorans]|uniref:Tyrosine-protein kinase ptk n=1 Tax=Tritonibacter multivorans TaxID=928856 RepID=A0A0P1GG97_9RHOB|nr:CpsD/CapB family tyrosine-protein kinase [Tritonibacter multivorans]MDA7422759.1 CpsD/CapB family tyrosine-protein kinase [Tritonibacter multivorans]CUH80863.1 Tyrosine-protein kinase ptk [Tritonibacter multivorans]SFD56835.1 Chromosome partitioning ATPase, Mrp family, contains Fe-S cluster [Tritonibacter multivorans]
MERLQAAIEKAQSDKLGRGRSPLRAGSSQEVEGRWQQLPELRLDHKAMQRNRIYAAEANQAAIAFDMLRTRTLRHMQQNGWTRLAITSPTPACGKSTLALNLAFAMARQPNTRTVQIEVDLRQPSQRRLLGANAGGQRALPDTGHKTLEPLFDGSKPFGEIAHRYGKGLALATNSHGIHNASDLLLGSEVGNVLQKVEEDYQPDIMIFDLPPMMVNDDTMAFQKHVDCVLLIAAAEQTSVAEIDHCERELASQTNVLGVVVNKCKLLPANSRYAYNYAYGS